MNYLLDTNMIIDWYTEGPGQIFLLKKIKEENCRLSTSWICAAEFLVKASKKEEKTFVQLIASEELTLHQVEGSSLLHQVIRMRKGLELPLPDCIILATAHLNKEILVTRDQQLYKKGKKIYSSIYFVK